MSETYPNAVPTAGSDSADSEVVEVRMTRREFDVLRQLSTECDIPADRVMTQGLRSYQLIHEAHKRGEPVQIGMPMPSMLRSAPTGG